MPTSPDRDEIGRRLEDFDLRALFIEELGWDRGGSDLEVSVAGRTYALEAVAHKRGLVAYRCVAASAAAFPDHPTRQKIEKAVAKTVREHLIVYVSHDRDAQCWQWVKREPGRPDRTRTHVHRRGQSGESLRQKLHALAFALDEEEGVTLIDVTRRVRAAFDVEKVTKRFYDRFKKEHAAFLGFIEGIAAAADREWYASLMLNRMMFIYFIQKRGFLDDDPDYLRNRLERVRQQQGNGNFHSFYRLFLLRLFPEGLGQPAAARAPELAALLGKVPYLNGGLFDVHDLERDNPDIRIPDDAFAQIFAFFDTYQWHLDDRPLRDDNEINPDVLGYIFEKYVNQKQMGAYYTKEDITGYISRNTVVPFLFDRARKDCSIAFEPAAERPRPGNTREAPAYGVWRLLADDPDRYLYEAVRHGITYDVHEKEALAEKRELPPEIAAGLDDVAQRAGWNRPAPPDYGLPTETWREHVARRQRYEEVRAKLAGGEVTSINDCITYNLDVEKFAHDAIAGSEGPELVRAFWKALRRVSILDPTCGSGAFLFAALNVLEPLYTACLDAMRGFLDDLERSQRPHRPEKLSDFRKVLHQVEAHASERYFILKSIIIDNLYGVDIMEEAVEICKLRLFLKLVAQLDTYEQIEPLPDVDFNVRAGNTLVGFTSLEEVKRTLSADLVKQLALPRIEERAEIADRAFRQFRAMQTEHGMDADKFAGAKADLRKRLDELRNELDEYLAGDYGVKVKSRKAYRQWRDSHQPFHWFVEFYGIMHRGGFDVVIGNPPYVETPKISSQYSLQKNALVETGNLYAICLGRFVELLGSRQRYGVIVPISSVSTPRMVPLMRLLANNSSIYISNFAVRPAKLFVGVDMNLSIWLGTPLAQKNSTRIFTTSYNRWNQAAREYLFSTISYAESAFNESFSAVFKIDSKAGRSILDRVTQHRPLIRFHAREDQDSIFYHSGGRYFRKCIRRKLSNEYKELPLQEQASSPILCLLSSSLYYWLWLAFSDCYHVTRPDVEKVPVPDPIVSDKKLHNLADALIDNLERNAQVRNRRRADGSKQQEVNYFVGKSKHIIDEIDKVLAEHYGFTDEELDFIINYDIKYRMGLSNPGGDED